jgi:cob(I)alamin adenosyltransferase
MADGEAIEDAPAGAKNKDSSRKRRRGLLVVNTGNGKGKTTAALGVLFRAWGRGYRVTMLEFIKSKTSNYGEHRAARKLGIELISLGGGFTWLSKDIEQDKALARECWEICKAKIASEDYDVVILDEFTYPLVYGWLPIDEVVETLRSRPPWLHVIVTGRDAPKELVEAADLVTEMREVKHPFQSGIKAQPGIEF